MNRSGTSRRQWLLVAGLVLGALRPGLAQSLMDFEKTVADVAAAVKPAVVSITAEHEAPATAVPTPSPTPTPPPDRPFGVSRGTGMIFKATDKEYYILTNAHVVRGARDRDVKVQIIAEREERDGHVVGADTRNDTAIVRIVRKPGDQLQVVKIGKVAESRVGSFVLAVGSPFGFDWTVSFGVVSGLDRELNEPAGSLDPGRRPEHYRGLVQTDASINPGNSGGPLVNLHGEVIGINFAIYAPGVAGNVGVGFAIPIDRAVRSAEDIIAYGRVKRAYLGVMVGDLEQEAKDQKTSLEEFKKLLGVDAGAYVVSVNPGTPAAKAGLQSGDVIVAVDGGKLANSGELVDRVSSLPPGSTVKLDVVRDGQPLQVSLTTAELPGEAGTPDRPADQPRPKRDPLGLRLTPMTPDLAKQLGIDPATKGVGVLAASPGGLGARRGLVQGTVLLRGRSKIGEVKVFDSVEAYQQFIAEAGERGALVQLWILLPPERAGAPRLESSRTIKLPKVADEGDEKDKDRGKDKE